MQRHIFEISRLNDGTGLKLSGELDAHSAGELTDALATFRKASEVWIDMTQVAFIDSSGLSSILSFARSRNGKGKVVILDPAAVVGPVFKLIGLDKQGIEVPASHPEQGALPLGATLDPALTTGDR